MFSITKHYKVWFAVSGILVAGSILVLALWGLPLGIDFRGGLLAELEFKNSVSGSEIKRELGAAGFPEPQVQNVSENKVIIKTKHLDESQTEEFKKILTEKFGEYQESRFESIGPTIGRELVKKAYWQILLVVMGILLYVSYAFRKVSKIGREAKVTAWKMGVATVIALIHDIVIPIGLFAFLGRYRGVEIDGLFITALLTIMGFSVHDTIVVFDRIRENLAVHPYKRLATIIDFSVISTMARSINTSSTLIFVLLALLLFGGQTIFYFVLALLVGVSVGTYSSIFIASPILYLWSGKL